MRDVLQRMLGVPVFLDSAELTDLRSLFTDGVHRTDCLVLLGTKGVLTRPWVLLELHEAIQQEVPVIVVALVGRHRDNLFALEEVTGRAQFWRNSARNSAQFF